MRPQCPSCGSRATEKVSIAYSKGMRINGTHISYSAFSSYCRPPEHKVVVGSLGWLIVAVLSFVFPWVFESSTGTINWDLFWDPVFGTFMAIAIVSAVTIVVRFFLMLHHAMFRLKAECELWDKQWVCRDCGEKFVPRTKNR